MLNRSVIGHIDAKSGAAGQIAAADFPTADAGRRARLFCGEGGVGRIQTREHIARFEGDNVQGASVTT
ncbi:hypothetical protein C1J03_19555 [Sulfitobacter sp. SK012]|nr:hypothetical protein C1J03_19555 [Sulfitobacter sp. SK012]